MTKRFLRPRTITLLRHKRDTTPGRGPYAASRAADEEVLLSGLHANVFAVRESRPITTGLPTGTMFRSLYKIVVAVEANQIQSKDVIKDEFGTRYQVMSVSQGWFGSDCLCEQMEV